MKTFLFPILAGFLTASQLCLGAEAEAGSMAGLLIEGGKLSKSEQRRLALLSLAHFEDLKRQLLTVRLGGDEVASLSASQALKNLNESSEKGIGAASSGMTVVWYLIVNDGQYSSIPMVSKVEEDSPASRAGILPGDVIDACEGISLISDASRNRFIRLLNLWPLDTPMQLDVRRSEHVSITNPSVKSRKKTLTLTLVGKGGAE